MDGSRFVLFSALALGCSSDDGPLKATSEVPAPGSISQAKLGGGTGADDVWLLATRSPTHWYHYDGAAWTEVPLGEVRVAQGTEFPDCDASTTAGRGAIYCASGAKVIRIDSSGAITDATANLPVPANPNTRHYVFNHAGSERYLATWDAGGPSHAIYRHEGDSWAELPALPGPVYSIVSVDDTNVWVQGEYPDPGPNLDPDWYYASLSGSEWTVSLAPRIPILSQSSHEVLLSPTNAWRLSGGGSETTWEFLHFTGTAWEIVSAPDALAPDFMGFAMTPSRAGKLALLSANTGGDVVMTPWDGTTVGGTVTIGHFTWSDPGGGQLLFTYLGQLGDGTQAFLNATGSNLLLGVVP